MIDLGVSDVRPLSGPPISRRSMAMPEGGMARIAGPLQSAMANYPTSMVTSHPEP
jgi:hypothetical protein